jgi:DNA-directed RNA polymerase subunit beta'
VVVRQMMRWVRIEDVGDTEYLIDEVVEKFRFISENERISALGKKRALGLLLLLGITKTGGRVHK